EGFTFAPALDQHGGARTDERLQVLLPEPFGYREERREPRGLLRLGHVVGKTQRRRVGPHRVLEAEDAVVVDATYQLERCVEVGFGFAGKPDDDVRRQREPG